MKTFPRLVNAGNHFRRIHVFRESLDAIVAEGRQLQALKSGKIVRGPHEAGDVNMDRSPLM